MIGRQWARDAEAAPVLAVVTAIMVAVAAGVLIVGAIKVMDAMDRGQHFEISSSEDSERAAVPCATNYVRCMYSP